MKKYILFAVFGSLIAVVAGVGIAHASKASSKEEKDKSTSEITKKHQDEIKTRTDARAERKSSQFTHDNFDNQKTLELNRVTRIISELEKRQASDTARAAFLASAGHAARSVESTSSTETDAVILAKLQDIKSGIESAGSSKDLETGVEALSDLIAPARK